MLQSLLRLVPQGDRYTYIFEGNSQALDHVFFPELWNVRTEIEKRS